MLPKGLYELYLKTRKICTDTRKIEPGAIFFALSGANFNANRFAMEAIDSGCVAAVVDDPSLENKSACFLVDDVLKTLQELANKFRNDQEIPFIAITGSNGKTTTKELMRDVLLKTFKVHATEGNLNNHIGVPLTLLSMPDHTEIAIIEMGANHQKEIEMLCRIAEPNYGLITNIGKAHLEGFGGIEGVKKGKGELFDFLRELEGKVFVDGEDKNVMELSAGMDRIIHNGEGNLQMDLISSDDQLVFSWEFGDFESDEVISQLTGSYNLQNIAYAISIGLFFGVEPSDINAAITEYMPENWRSQWVKTGRNEIILDAYNANPSSMELALRNLAGIRGKEKYFIIGDMLELGEASEKEHKAIVNLTDELGLIGIYVGREFEKVLGKNAPHFRNVKELSSHLREHFRHGKLILLKGSRGIRLETLKEYL